MTEVDFNPEFVSRMIPKLEWAVLCEAANSVSYWLQGSVPAIVCLPRVWQSLFCDKTFEFAIQTWQTC